MTCQKLRAAVWLIFALSCLSEARADTKKDEAEPEPEKAIRALLVTGGASHDYSVRKDLITRGIRERVAKKIEWKVRFQGDGESDVKIPLFDSPTWAEGYDIVVHDYCFPRVRDTDYVDRILAPHQSGIPAVLIHGVMHSFRTGDSRWFDFCGVTSRRHDISYPLTITPRTPLSPIWGGLDTWMTPAGQLYLVDEVPESTSVLGTAIARGNEKEHPVVWQHRYGPAKSRVFGMTPGNDLTTMVQPEYLDVLARGFLWALDAKGEGAFKVVAPEASLSGFVLPDPVLDLPAVGARALEFTSANILMPGEEIRSSPWTGLLAVDRDSGTSWLPEKAGAVTWQGKLTRPSSVSSMVIVWDNSPPRYSLSTSMDGLSWEAWGDPVHEGRSPTALHEILSRKVRWVRVDLLPGGRAEPSGIRELGVYTSASDVPAGFRVEKLPQEITKTAPGPLLSLDDNRVGNEFLLSVDRQLVAMEQLPAEMVVKSIVTKASGSAFLLVSSGAREDAAYKVLYCDLGDSEIAVSTYLDGISPNSIIGWDGEWLYVFDGATLSQYRGAKGSGVADERNSQGTLFAEELSEAGTPVNRVFHEMVVAPDGWIYASFSQDVQSETFSKAGKMLILPEHGMLRFTRHLDSPELVVSSRSKIGSFFIDGQSVRLGAVGKAKASYELPPIAADLRSLEPLGDVNSDAVVRGSGKNNWFEIEAGSVAEALREGASIKRTEIARIPGLIHFSLDGLNNAWFVRRSENANFLEVGVLSHDHVAPEFDLDEVATENLVGFLGKGTERQMEGAFYELLRRKLIPEKELEAVVNSREKGIKERVLALRLLVESEEGNALNRLVKWSFSEEPELRRLAFLLLGNVSGTVNHEAFSRIAEETSPSVTAAIISGIYRSGSSAPALDKLILKLAATPEPEVANAALAFLSLREGTTACFEALDDPKQRELWPASFKVVSESRRQTVVEGLGDRLARTTDPEFRLLCLSALCRLHASPSGGTWEGSGFVGSLLRASLSDRRVDKAHLLDEMIAYQIPFPIQSLVSLAREDLSLEPFVVDRLMTSGISPQAAPWLREIIESESRDSLLKRKAMVALAGIEDTEIYMSLLDPISDILSEEPRIGDQIAALLKRWRENPIRSEAAEALIKKTKGKDLAKSRLAWEPLLRMRDDFKGGGTGIQAVVERIDEILFTNQSGIKSLLLAMKRVSSFELPRALAVIESGSDEELKQFVKEEGISDRSLPSWSPSLVAPDVQKFLAEAGSVSGDSEGGYEWFRRAGCSDCHNIHGEGPSLGPDLSFRTDVFDLGELLVSVSDPAAKVSDALVLHTLEMKDGTRLIGADVNSEDEKISFIDTVGERISVPESSVHRKWVEGGSLMPQLGAGEMTSQDLADLKAFLDTLVIPGLTANEVN